VKHPLHVAGNIRQCQATTLLLYGQVAPNERTDATAVGVSDRAEIDDQVALAGRDHLLQQALELLGAAAAHQRVVWRENQMAHACFLSHVHHTLYQSRYFTKTTSL